MGLDRVDPGPRPPGPELPEPLLHLSRYDAQRDGEVRGTAIETPMRTRLRFGLVKGAQLPAPQFDLAHEALTFGPRGEGSYGTTGAGPDLMEAAKDAVRAMIDHLGRSHDLPPELAYALCSVAVDLRISEVVDAPNWVVSAHLAKGIVR